MSHRIKRFAEIAIFASFYLFAVVDSILGFRGHHVDTKSVQPNDFFSLPKIARLVSLFRLFERNHQRVDLTDAGRVFVEEAREAVLRAERAVLVAKATFSGADEILNIGKSPHGDPCLVSTLLSIHLPLFPGLRVNLWSDYSNELAHQVIVGTLDLALITGVPNNPKLSVLRVADDPFYVAMLANDDLAVNREVHLSGIHNRDWIFQGRQASPYLYDTFQIVASDKGAIAADISYVMTPEEASELIHEHRGIAFLPRTCAWRIARDGITMRPLIEERLHLITNLATRSDSKSRLVKEFFRATAKKLGTLMPAIQGQLPLTGPVIPVP